MRTFETYSDLRGVARQALLATRDADVVAQRAVATLSGIADEWRAKADMIRRDAELSDAGKQGRIEELRKAASKQANAFMRESRAIERIDAALDAADSWTESTLLRGITEHPRDVAQANYWVGLFGRCSAAGLVDRVRGAVTDDNLLGAALVYIEATNRAKAPSLGDAEQEVLTDVARVFHEAWPPELEQLRSALAALERVRHAVFDRFRNVAGQPAHVDELWDGLTIRDRPRAAAA